MLETLSFVLFMIIMLAITLAKIIGFLIEVLPGQIVGEVGDWISFSGSYIGVLGAVGTVWWQMKKEENDEIRGLLLEIKDILEYNKKNYTLDDKTQINYERAGIAFNEDNEDNTKIKLKSFTLDKSDKRLLYKHNYKKIIDLDNKIKEVLESYSFSPKEENIFNKIIDFIEKKETTGELEVEIQKVHLILSSFSAYLFILGFKEGDIKKNKKKVLEQLKCNLAKLNKKLISQYINEEKYLNPEKVIDLIKENNKDIHKLYILYLMVFRGLVSNIDINTGVTLRNSIFKKCELLSERYEELISEIENESKKL